jgi:hypothetical protein
MLKSTEFDEEVEVEEFPTWLETKLAVKYECSLAGLMERFKAIFSLLRIILETLLDINDLVTQYFFQFF